MTSNVKIDLELLGETEYDYNSLFSDILDYLIKVYGEEEDLIKNNYITTHPIHLRKIVGHDDVRYKKEYNDDECWVHINYKKGSTYSSKMRHFKIPLKLK